LNNGSSIKTNRIENQKIPIENNKCRIDINDINFTDPVFLKKYIWHFYHSSAKGAMYLGWPPYAPAAERTQ